MVEEEAEVFRKGTVLLGPEEMEGEYDGEELRIEVRLLLSSQAIFSTHASFSSFLRQKCNDHRHAL